MKRKSIWIHSSLTPNTSLPLGISGHSRVIQRKTCITDDLWLHPQGCAILSLPHQALIKRPSITHKIKFNHVFKAHGLAYAWLSKFEHLTVCILLCYFNLHDFAHTGPSAKDIHILHPFSINSTQVRICDDRINSPNKLWATEDRNSKKSTPIFLIDSYSIQFSSKRN